MNIPLLLSRLKELDVKIWLEGDQVKLNAPKGAVTPELQTQIIANKQQIIDFLRESSSVSIAPPVNVEPQPCGSALPLSYAQQRMWFLDFFEPGNAAFTIIDTRELTGVLNIQALEKSISEILRRHSALRTVFQIDSCDQPIQIVQDHTPFELAVIDLQVFPSAIQEEEAQTRITQLTRVPFMLSTGPLFRCTLFRFEATRHWLLIQMHHIVSDGWSMSVFMNELISLYQAYTKELPSRLPELPIQYADYAVWQRDSYRPESFRPKLDYWIHKLSGPLPILDLPADHPRPSGITYNGATYRVQLPKDLVQKINHLCSQQEVTLFMLLLAAFQTLLYRITGQEDLIIGTPTANRGIVEVEPLIGLFMNTLALRTSLFGNPTFSELLTRVRDAALEAFAHQDVPFEMIVEELRLDRDTSHSAIFQVLFILQNAPVHRIQNPVLGFRPIKINPKTAKHDLTLEIWSNPEGEFFELEYNTDLFEAETIERMARQYQTLLEGICAHPEQPISQLPLLTPDERRQILVEWNDTRADFPRHLTLPALFEAQAQLSPQAVAICDEQEQITYAELDRRANRLARFLHNLGVGPEVLVGVCLPRSIDMVVSLLAILKAGGAYLPLDPNFPPDRLAFMLTDSGAHLLLTHSSLAALFPAQAVQSLCLDTLAPAIDPLSSLPFSGGATPESLAYLLYTSGSTGQPKGVQVLQRNLVNFLTSMRRQPGIAPSDVLLSVTTLSFDIAGLELYLPLISGARLVLVSAATAADGYCLKLALEQSGATFMQATPATWRLLLGAGWQGSLQFKILCGGEALPPDLAASLLGCCAELWNMYGPTETTIWSTLARISSADEPITIGRPIANTQVYLLDPCGQPLPPGIPGELFIGGEGVARGYLNRPELNAEKFIPDPFSSDPQARLYRTGDLARYRSNGLIEFLRRRDDQVKINGVRIELGEITTTLLKHPQVESAVVVGCKEEEDRAFLIAYLVAASENPPAPDELRFYLSQKLPVSMIPFHYIFLDQLPLTPNGKIDYKSLPKPAFTPQPPSNHMQPRNTVEAKLVQIWKNLLHVDQIGIQDDFFQLGGHSLLAVQMLIQIKAKFNVYIPLISLFQKANIEHIAILINEQHGCMPWPSLVEIQPAGTRPPIFCVHGLTGDVVWFSKLVAYMDPDQPVWGLESRGLDGIQKPLETIEEIAANYIQEIQSVQPEGPYFICGYSFGGSVVYEMACQLAEQGQKVGLAAIIDHASPKSDYYRVTYNLAFFQSMLKNLPQRFADITYLKPGEFLARLRLKSGGLLKKLAGTFKPKVTENVKAKDLIDYGADLPVHIQNVIEVNYRAIMNFTPRRYPGTVTLIHASGERLFVSHDPQMGWGKFADSVAVKTIYGSHLRLFLEPNIQHLARQLQNCLKEANP